MFSTFRKLFGKQENGVVDAPAPALRPAAAVPRQNALAQHPATANGHAPALQAAATATGSLSVPVKSMLARLPADLSKRVRNVEFSEADIDVPLQRILGQISHGVVKINFGELRLASPPGTFGEETDADAQPVEVPLNEILSRLDPALLPRRPSQKHVSIPAEIAGPFGGQNKVTFTTAPLKADAAAPAAPAAPAHEPEPAHQAVPIRMPTPIQATAPASAVPSPFAPAKAPPLAAGAAQFNPLKAAAARQGANQAASIPMHPGVPVQPMQRTPSTQPAQPAQPSQPAPAPSKPAQPVVPANPFQPAIAVAQGAAPVRPAMPAQPAAHVPQPAAQMHQATAPIKPVVPMQAVQPAARVQPVAPVQPAGYPQPAGPPRTQIPVKPIPASIPDVIAFRKPSAPVTAPANVPATAPASAPASISVPAMTPASVPASPLASAPAPLPPKPVVEAPVVAQHVEAPVFARQAEVPAVQPQEPEPIAEPQVAEPQATEQVAAEPHVAEQMAVEQPVAEPVAAEQSAIEQQPAAEEPVAFQEAAPLEPLAPIKPVFTPPAPVVIQMPSAPRTASPGPLGPITPIAPEAEPEPAPIRFSSPPPSIKAPAAPAPAPAPAAPAAPVANVKGSLAGETRFLTLPIAEVAGSWPASLQEEIMTHQLTTSAIALPFGMIEQAIRQGRIALPWKTLRSWIKPPVNIASSPNDSMILELPLKIVTPLFLAELKASPAQKKTVLDENIPNLFSNRRESGPSGPVVPGALSQQSAAESQPEAPSLMAFQARNGTPSSGAPAAAKQDTNYFAKAGAATSPSAGAVAKAKQADTNYFAKVNGEQSEEPAPPLKKGPSPGTAFLQRYATPNEIVSKASAMPGVEGALIALPDGLLVASRVPGNMNGDTIAGFLSQIFNRVSQCTKELRMGDLNNLNFTIGAIPWKIFKVGAIYFAAFGRPGEPLPTAQLASIAAELDRKA